MSLLSRRKRPTPARTPYPVQADRPLRLAPKPTHWVRICGTEMDGEYYFMCRTCNATGGRTPDRRLAVRAGCEHGDVVR